MIEITKEKTKKQREFNLRHQDKSCQNCRYYREQKTGCWTGECLLIGRTLSIFINHSDLFPHALSRICDGWKKRPKTWNIISEGVGKNPHWVDPYLSRKTLQNLRKKFKFEFGER